MECSLCRFRTVLRWIEHLAVGNFHLSVRFVVTKMKILIIITFCSIAGVQYLTTACSPSPIRSGVPRFIDLLGYVNTTDEEVEDFDRVLCEKNGGSKAFNDYIVAKYNFRVCIEAFGNEVRKELHGKNYSDDIHVRKFCVKMPIYEKCVDNFFESVKTCLDTSKLETLHMVYNTSRSIEQFLCEDDALRMRTFISANGNECTNTKRSDLLLCACDTLVKYIRGTFSDGAGVGGIGILDLLAPDATKCSIFNHYQVCVVDLLKGCPNHTAVADLANSLFHMVKNATACDRLVRSAASSTNVVDIL